MQEDLLHGIEKPGRYIGSEINAYRKNFEEARVRFVLGFPDVYEVGLSHLGLRWLYHMLNRLEGVMADRVYAPWQDFESRLRESGEPLLGMESEHPLGDFDFVGFSLQYELSYSNILTILERGRIPLRAADRDLSHPWIIAGGPCAFNPEPLADFLDFVVLGEAEQVLPELVDVFLEWKAARGSRLEFLQRVRKLPGVYVPSFFHVSYHRDGLVASIEPRYPDYTSVRKRLVQDLDRDAPLPATPLVPLLDIVHNRLGLEIARGCTRGCRFCQAGYIYRPVRERDPLTVLAGAQQALAASGYEEVSLLSLSTGDYCQIQGLLAALMEQFGDRKIAVSFPSMRVGTLTPELMELVQKVRKTGFTLAPEAGSERLRRVINKEILDQDLLAAAENAFGLGWRLLKLYFMMGLPTETAQDLDALVALCLKVWQLAKPSRASINASVSTFVPKPHTPFQWMPQLSRRAIEDQLEQLSDRLRRPGLRFKWHHPGHSILEAVFARGDRRLGAVLLRAWQLGARFDGWTEILQENLWQQAFRETGLDPAFYAQRARDREEILPWDHLSSGVEKGFLLKEYDKALVGEFTGDCRWDRCTVCGVCDHKSIQPLLHSDAGTLESRENAAASGVRSDPEFFSYWFRYSKMGKIRFFGQLEIAQGFARAVRRAGLPAAYSKGFHPHMKLSFGEALPLGLESRVEEAYLTLTERIDARRVQSLLNAHFPEGLKIEEMEQVTQRRKRPRNLRVTYRVSKLIPWIVRNILQNWSKRLGQPMVKKTKRREVRASLGEVLLDVRPVDEFSLEMDLYEGVQGCFRPTAILHHLLGESAEVVSQCRICKVAQELLEESEDVQRAHHQCQFL